MRCYEARRAVLGEQHLLTLLVCHGAACVLRLRGRPAQAEEEYRSVLADCVGGAGAASSGDARRSGTGWRTC